MTVAFITHDSSLYGANKSLLNLIEGLKYYGVTSCVIVPKEGPLSHMLEELKIPFRVIYLENWAQSVQEEKSMLRKLRQFFYIKRQVLKRILKNIKSFPVLVAQLKCWDVDLVYSNSSAISIGFFAAKYLNKPHVQHIREFLYKDYRMKFDWGNRLSNKLLKESSAKISVSKIIQEHYFSKDDRNSYVVYNGVATKVRFDELYQEAALMKNLNNNFFTFAIVGFLHPAKGHEAALRALAQVLTKFDNIKMIVAGDGNKDSIDKVIDELELKDYVEFLGYVHDPFTVYKTADCVLVCSPSEAMGRVTVETMAACCPVIGYNAAGTAEIIKHNETGLLYNGSHDELAAAMMRMIGEPVLRQRLVKSAWKEARENFSIETYAEKIYHILRNLLH